MTSIHTYQFNEEQRFRACMKQAAHAVVFSINSGCEIYAVEVAPLHSEHWKARDGRGALLADQWGACRMNKLPFAKFVKWDCYLPDYAPKPEEFDVFLRSKSTQSYAGDVRRQVRAAIAGYLAGKIADELFEPGVSGPNKFSEPCWIHPDWIQNDATAIADGLARLLPYKNEYEHMCVVTEDLLQAFWIWGRVVHLAEALAEKGKVAGKELKGFLPPHDPTWPPSPIKEAAKQRARLLSAGLEVCVQSYLQKVKNASGSKQRDI